MLNHVLARGRAWFSRIQSRRKRSHRRRQDAAHVRAATFHNIHGESAQEIFARRIAYLRRLDPLVFEEMVLDAFQKKGWLVERNTRYTGDGGLDGKIFRNGTWYGIQCKRYKEAIKTDHVKHFCADLKKQNLEYGFFVHTGRTPKKAHEIDSQIEIFSGQKLIALLETSQNIF